MQKPHTRPGTKSKSFFFKTFWKCSYNFLHLHMLILLLSMQNYLALADSQTFSVTEKHKFVRPSSSSKLPYHSLTTILSSINYFPFKFLKQRSELHHKESLEKQTTFCHASNIHNLWATEFSSELYRTYNAYAMYPDRTYVDVDGRFKSPKLPLSTNLAMKLQMDFLLDIKKGASCDLTKSSQMTPHIPLNVEFETWNKIFKQDLLHPNLSEDYKDFILCLFENENGKITEANLTSQEFLLFASNDRYPKQYSTLSSNRTSHFCKLKELNLPDAIFNQSIIERNLLDSKRSDNYDNLKFLCDSYIDNHQHLLNSSRDSNKKLISSSLVFEHSLEFQTSYVIPNPYLITNVLSKYNAHCRLCETMLKRTKTLKRPQMISLISPTSSNLDFPEPRTRDYSKNIRMKPFKNCTFDNGIFENLANSVSIECKDKVSSIVLTLPPDIVPMPSTRCSFPSTDAPYIYSYEVTINHRSVYTDTWTKQDILRSHFTSSFPEPNTIFSHKVDRSLDDYNLQKSFQLENSIRSSPQKSLILESSIRSLPEITISSTEMPSVMTALFSNRFD